LKSYVVSFLLFTTFLLLASCGKDTNVGQLEETNHQNLQVSQEKKESFKELSEEEAKKIVKENIENQNKVMMELTEEYPEWWSQNFEEETEEFVKANEIVKEKLSPYVSNRALETYSGGYLISYFCECGGFDLLTSRNIDVRFQIEEQTKDRLEVSFISLEDLAGYNNVGTYFLHFRKIDGTWKLTNERYIDSKKLPLNLTSEEIYAAFPNTNVVILDEVEFNNQQYFIIVDNDLTYGVNKKDSSINYEIAENYQ